MLFAVIWKNLEIIILSEASQRKTNTWYYIYVEYKKMIQMNLYKKQKYSHKHRKQTYVYQKQKGGGIN